MLRVHWLTLGALLPMVVVSNVACEDAGDGTRVYAAPDGDGTGVELAAWEAHAGSVSLTGSSDAVPVSNESYTGKREMGDEATTVVCNWDASGALDIFASTGLDYEVELSVEGLPPVAPFDSHFRADETTSLALKVVLGSDEAGAYTYEFGTDENSTPNTSSYCYVYIAALSSEEVTGNVQCLDLLASETSPDYPLTNAPRPTASTSVAFACPVWGLGDETLGGTGAVDGTDGTSEGTTAPVCQGSPTSCSLLTESECSNSLGCNLSGGCSGTSALCSSLGSNSCGSQSGCTWLSYTGECAGFADSCPSISTSLTCSFQDGCSWGDECEGAALECDMFSTRTDCDEQPGCTWR